MVQCPVLSVLACLVRQTTSLEPIFEQKIWIQHSSTSSGKSERASWLRICSLLLVDFGFVLCCLRGLTSVCFHEETGRPASSTWWCQALIHGPMFWSCHCFIWPMYFPEQPVAFLASNHFLPLMTINWQKAVLHRKPFPSASIVTAQFGNWLSSCVCFKEGAVFKRKKCLCLRNSLWAQPYVEGSLDDKGIHPKYPCLQKSSMRWCVEGCSPVCKTLCLIWALFYNCKIYCEGLSN